MCGQVEPSLSTELNSPDTKHPYQNLHRKQHLYSYLNVPNLKLILLLTFQYPPREFVTFSAVPLVEANSLTCLHSPLPNYLPFCSLFSYSIYNNKSQFTSWRSYVNRMSKTMTPKPQTQTSLLFSQ